MDQIQCSTGEQEDADGKQIKETERGETVEIEVSKKCTKDIEQGKNKTEGSKLFNRLIHSYASILHNYSIVCYVRQPLKYKKPRKACSFPGRSSA